jgi:hypothetical protein
MSKEEVHEKIIYREVIREKVSEPKWESGSLGGLILLSFLLPIVGVIVGGMNLKHHERKDQATGLLICGIVFWVFWMFAMGVIK